MKYSPASLEHSLIDLFLGREAEPNGTSEPPRLLLVDDEPKLLTSLQRLLDGRGYQLETASTGREAINHLDQQDFDLLLLDLHLPDVYGYEILRHATDQGMDICTIVVSGDSDIDAAIRALKEGAYGFVRKPYTPDELLNKVHNAIGHLQSRRENERIRKRLEHSEKLYRFLVDESPDLIYTLDAQGHLTFVNRRFETLLGYKAEQLLGRHYSVLLLPQQTAVAEHVFQERRQGDRACRNVELRLRSNIKNEGPPFEVTLVTLVFNAVGIYSQSDAQPCYIGSYGIARDISERRRAEDLLAYHASHDILTQLPNRALFKERLELAMIQAKRSNQTMAVMIVDLDRFKWINDNLGLLAGDEVLRIAAMRIQACLNSGDVLARLAGDEFAILHADARSTTQIEHVAECIQRTMGEPCQAGEHEVFLSASIGISLYPEHGNTADALIRNAEIAMNHVKAGGKNGQALYDRSMHNASHLKVSLERELRQAVREGELIMFYQPQVDGHSGRIIGVEALMRWQHPERGLLSAGDIIPLAEEIGLLSGLSDWVLESTLTDLQSWLDDGLDPIRLSVNISPSYLEQDDFIDRVLSSLESHNVPAELLELEVTEGLAIRNFEAAINKLGFLANANLRVAIDDFGVGYSSLSYLQRFPLHTLKIDRAFISEITSTSQRTPIVQIIISVARSLELDVVAEGVEHSGQVEYLLAHGCNLMQGYFYHKPMPASDLVKLLRIQNGPDRDGDAAKMYAA
jgi:diguanylate cyclase (GGDEF)-like protein/PAS domain S-box-containing protein